MTGNILHLTEAAVARVKALVAESDSATAGLRISVSPQGCSGLSYKMEYAAEKSDHDDVIEEKGATVFIDPAATLFLLGSELDYVEDRLQSGFVFKNPNEKGRCGCGESFFV